MNPIIFSLSIPDVCYILIAIGAMSAIVAVLYGLSSWRRVAGYDNPYSLDTDKGRDSMAAPSVTVVVYNFCCREMLDDFMESVMRQDYENYKVVMVCDATASATAQIAERYAERYGNRLYVTFIPPGSHNLSRRKLAYTVGIKAADSEYVVTTTSNTIIPSESWLSEMMSPVCAKYGNSEYDRKEVVLGYGHILFSELKGCGRWFKQFDDVCTSAQWIGAAIAHKPYRGDGFNLLFKRELFFRQKGYSATINLENGDDDLFVDSICTPANTSVMLSKDSMVQTYWGESADRIRADLKERYDFTQRWLPHAPFLKTAFTSLLQWVALAAFVAAAVIDFPNLLTLVICVAAMAVFWLLEILSYRGMAAKLNVVRLWWALPLFMLWRPIATLCFRLSRQPNRIKNFTWQRRK